MRMTFNTVALLFGAMSAFWWVYYLFPITQYGSITLREPNPYILWGEVASYFLIMCGCVYLAITGIISKPRVEGE
jgi:hypothetical protein